MFSSSAVRTQFIREGKKRKGKGTETQTTNREKENAFDLKGIHTFPRTDSKDEGFLRFKYCMSALKIVSFSKRYVSFLAQCCQHGYPPT